MNINNTYKCIDKIRNKKGDIQLYHLVNVNNSMDVQIITPRELKNLMILCNVQVENLKLTSDGRLIDRKEDRYYRYYIYDNYNKKFIGGLFRGINSIINIIEEEYRNYEDAEDLNILVSKLEYNLKLPSIKNKNITFYYTYEGNKQAKTYIDKINTILIDYNYCIKVDVKTNVGKIIYRDKDQVAVLIDKTNRKTVSCNI